MNEHKHSCVKKNVYKRFQGYSSVVGPLTVEAGGQPTGYGLLTSVVDSYIYVCVCKERK